MKEIFIPLLAFAVLISPPLLATAEPLQQIPDTATEENETLAIAGAKEPEQSGVGASVITMTNEIAAKMRQRQIPIPASRNGVVVTSIVPDGPADRAGLCEGDIIVKIGDVAIPDGSRFQDTIRGLRAGKGTTFYFRHVESKPVLRWVPKSATVTPITKDELVCLIARTCPLAIIAIGLDRDIIGTPEITMRLKNRSTSNAIAFEVDVECWNRFDEKVIGIDRTHIHHGIGQATIPAGEEREVAWRLSLRNNTAKATASIVRVMLKNGLEWKSQMSKNPPTAHAEIPD